MANKYEEFVRDEWQKFIKGEKKLLPNIMLLGKTGCGKSSLINVIFKKDIAPVNDVSRGTEGFETYKGEKYGMGVNLIDSRGYEMEDGGEESFSSYNKSIKDKMEESRRKDPLEKIHIIWYCISVLTHIEPYDIEILKLLREEAELRSRVCVAITKCDQDDEDGSTAKIFRQIIAEKIGSNVPVFEVSTESGLEIDLEKMMDWSANLLDNEDLKEAFVASQMFSLKAKREAATARIAFYVASAAGIGASPIPMSDSALLVPLQLMMSAHIIRIYGMDNFEGISKTLIGDIVVSNLGKAVAGGLLKLIPGVGTLVGGLINASVASLITSALGFAISEICYDSCKKIAKGEYVDITETFNAETIKSYTQAYMEKYKKPDESYTGKEDVGTFVKEYMKTYKN